MTPDTAREPIYFETIKTSYGAALKSIWNLYFTVTVQASACSYIGETE
jgi:hypothetical protein